MSVSPASDPARRQAPRALGRQRSGLAPTLARAALCALTAVSLLPFAAARAQTVDANGQIYIPGPGETRGASASGATLSIPGPGQTQGAAPAGDTGMIVIPGPGETRGAAASMPAAATSSATSLRPAPRAVPTNPTIAINATHTANPTSRAIPVVETAPQRAVRAVQPVAVEQPSSAAATPIATAAAPRQGAQAPAPGPAAASLTAAASMPAAAAPASNAPAGQQDGETIRRAALAYLEQQTVGLPGKIRVTVAPSFPRGLAACATLEPFMPTGARLWGSTTVGVRCAGAKPWTLYLQARVSIEATYYLAARQIEAGATVTAEDLLARDGDLSNLPRAIITDPSQAVGSSALMRISAGMPLRQDLLKSASAVAIGQTVRVVAQGQGFTISSEGSVMNNAAPGQQVRVKMAGGQIISGIVKDGATVQVQM